MWNFVVATLEEGRGLKWKVTGGSGLDDGLPDTEGLAISIGMPNFPPSAFAAIHRASAAITAAELDWLRVENGQWYVDFDRLTAVFPGLANRSWMHGSITGTPELVREAIRSRDAKVSLFVTSEMLGPVKDVKTTGAGYEPRWEVIRHLGEGGCGRVDLVRDKNRCSSFKVLREQLLHAIRGASLPITPHERDDTIAQILDSLRQLTSEDPAHLGALKLLHAPDKARDPDLDRSRERISREIAVMRGIDHPHLLRLLDAGPDDLWFVSEYHPNGTLDHYQRRYAGNVPAALRAIRPIVEAVAGHLHARGVVHRDIKAPNVLVASDNRLVLGDFGLVFFEDDERTRLSQTLDNVGSWDWMPEWAQGVRIEDIRPNFDVFCLGKLLWWMVTGLPIQRLRLWRYEKPEVNVEHLFPDQPFIQLLNPLLAQCVLEEPDDCLPDASALLEGIDRCLQVIGRNADQIGLGVRRVCSTCGLGTYVPVTEQNDLSMVVDKISGRRRRVERCDHCGVVQIFMARDDDTAAKGFFTFDGMEGK